MSRTLLRVICTAVVASTLAPSATAAEPDYDLRAGRFEPELEVVVRASRSSDFMDQLEPATLVGISFGYFVAGPLRLGAAFRSAVANKDADFLEVMADATAATTIKRFRFSASLEVGYQQRELFGSDFIFSDHGFSTNLAIQPGFVLFDDFAVSLAATACLTHSDAHDRNSSLDEWLWELRATLVLGVLI